MYYLESSSSYVKNFCVMRKKIAIITTHHVPNYGNKLQNYALQTLLKRLGHDVEVINDVRLWPDMNSWWAQRKNILHCIIPYRQLPYHIKYTKFFLWSRNHICYSKTKVHSVENLSYLADKYDLFVVGADQIWNPEWKMFSNELGFATFARKEQKIAYAPSLGVSKIPKERITEYIQWLKDWKALSCREDEGAALLKELTGKEVPVVLDPTLLFTRHEWDEIVPKRLVEEKYLLVYSVLPMRNEFRKYIEEFAQKSNLRVISLSEGKYSACGPTEFISLIKHASHLITDSFHGSVFAIHYHVHLTIINPAVLTGDTDKTSSLKTLFREIGKSNADFSHLFNEFIDFNWEKVDLLLSKEREKSMDYLINAIEKQ